jgi:hypothetical protein
MPNRPPNISTAFVKHVASRRITIKATTELAMVGNVLNGSHSLLRGEREPLRETDRPE